ncbi:hypothetical protein MUK42_34243 [Musa troglodytarum]|uniref:Uncharacterized protein n=1 Tax=Musa troglodytarum TaxID=320322 RepID=A0A9E7GB39_9LILI|nr:hypothetical protein MUK42_34243 [Musa troglodytarum]
MLGVLWSILPNVHTVSDSVPPADVVATAPAVPFHRLVHDRSIARPYLSSHTPLTSTADLLRLEWKEIDE